MASSGGQPRPFDAGPVWVDKEQVVHYNGDPSYGEEYTERVWLAYFSLGKEEAKQSYVVKLKNALTGRAWTMVHKRPEIGAEKLMNEGTTKPKETVELLLATPQ